MYTPFDKKFADICSEDLENLKNVHEGWYVDYKGSDISSKAYAKAIAAMANTYGGWIFVGIQEESKDNNVAGSFPGIAPDQIDIVSQKIRQSVKEHLNPTPFFELRVIESPEKTNSNSILFVSVPESNRAPIIHSDGRIYRRINDSSEPVPVNDRQVVDHLIKRVEKTEKYFSKWDDEDPILSKDEDELSYLRLLMVPDYWGDENLSLNCDASKLKEILNTPTKSISLNMEFDTIYSQSTGFICRSTNGNNPSALTPTLRIGPDLVNEFILPMNSSNMEFAPRFLNNYSNKDSLIDYLTQNDFKECRLLDVNNAFAALDAIFVIQKKLETHAGYSGKTYAKFKLCNVWRHIPLIDASPDELCWPDFGVPVIQSTDLSVWPGGSLDSFIETNLHKNETEDQPFISLSIYVYIKFLKALGFYVGTTTNFAELVSKLRNNIYKSPVKND